MFPSLRTQFPARYSPASLPNTRRFSMALAVLVLALPVVSSAGTYTVTSNADTGATGTLRWAIAQANANAGSTINLNNNLGTITLTKAMDIITAAVTINGGTGNTVSGNNLHRIFFVDAATPTAAVNISNLSLINGRAKGGDGGAGGGGGGLGAGGAIFVNSGAVRVQGVTFANNAAIGGLGGAGGIWFDEDGEEGPEMIRQAGGGGGLGGAGGAGGPDAGGGGGYGGAGGSVTDPRRNGSGGGGGLIGNGGGNIEASEFGGGGGGGGLTNGSPTTAKYTGGVPGIGGGGGGTGDLTDPIFYDGGDGALYGGGGGGSARGGHGGDGGKFGGGGGGGPGALGGVGGNFGGGGGAVGGRGIPAGLAGNGGFGGGGGGGASGFFASPGSGGFGGGGGGGPLSATYQGGWGGYLGGSGFHNRSAVQAISGGGGGGAAGGAIFVRAETGGSLTLIDSGIDQGSASGGAGGSFQAMQSSNGSGAGSALFLNGGSTNLRVTTGTATIAGSIADAGPAGIPTIDLAKSGEGTLVLSGDSTYTAKTSVNAGTLTVTSSNGLGATSAPTTVAIGATLNLHDVTIGEEAIHLLGAGVGGGGALTATGMAFLAGPVELSSPGASMGGSGTLVLQDSVSGGFLIKAGGGTLELQGSNTFTGVTSVNSGTLWIRHPDSLGTTSAGTTIAPGATLGVGTTLELGEVELLEPITLAGTGHSNKGALHGLAAGALSGPVTLDSTIGATANIDSPFSFSIDGPVSGGALTKTGDGSLELGGTNTYTGATFINGGTLVLRSGSASPSFAIASGTVLALKVESGERDGGVDTIITGGGTLQKTGTGNAAWNSKKATFALGYGSLIDVQGGLFVGGSSGNEDWSANLSDLNVAGGAVFWGAEANVKVNALSGSGNIRSGLSGSGYTGFTFGVDNGSGTFAGSLRDTDTAAGHLGKFIKVGTGTQTLSGASTYTGGTTVSGGTLVLENASALGTAGPITMNGGTLRFSASNTTDYSGRFSGAAGNQNWLLNTNGQTVNLATALTGSTNTVVKSGAGTLAMTGGSDNATLNATVHAGTLRLDKTSSASVHAIGGTVTINNSGTVRLAGSGDDQIASTAIVQINSGGTFDLAGKSEGIGVLNGVGTVTNLASGQSAVLTVGENGASGTFGGNISGNMGLSKVGSGTLTLLGPNTFSRGIQISGGVLAYASDSNLGATGSSIISASGGTLRNTASVTTGRSIELSAGGLTLDASGGSLTLTNAISGSGGLTKTGANSLILTGAAAHTGGTTISTGTLQVGNGGTTGSLAGNVTNHGTLTYNRSDAGTLAGVISGGGSLSKAGGGVLTLTGTNAYYGGTAINAGTLQIGAGGTTGSITGHISNQAALIFNRSDDLSFPGGISGTGTLTKLGAGTLTLSGSNASTGGTTIDAGILALSGEDNPSNVVFNTTINAGGTLRLLDNNQIGTSTITVNGGVLDFNGRIDYFAALALSNGGTVSGGGAFTLESTGTPLISATGGGNAGIISTNFGITSQYGVGGGANRTVQLDTATNTSLTVSGAIRNTLEGTASIGSLNKTGTGTLSLTGANTYSGNTTVSAGTLQLSGSTASPAFAIAPGAFLEMNVATGARDHGADTTFSGAGTLVKSGTSNVFWGAAKATFALGSGSLIDVQGGTLIGGSNGNEVWTANFSNLNVAAGATFWGAEANVKVNTLTGAGSIRSGLSGGGYSAFTFGADNGSGTFAGTLGDTDTAAGHLGKFIKAGTGTQILTGTNTFSGPFTIADPGTVQIGNGGTTGTLGTGTVENGGTLRFDRSNLIAVSNAISGSGRVVQSGTGTLNLAGANTYTGTTAINNGTLAFSGTMTGTGALTVESSGTLAGASTLPMPVTVQSGGTIAPGINGAGTLTLSGAVSLSGGCKLHFDLGTLSDRLVLSGSYTPPASGTVIVNVAGLAGFGDGSYPLITGVVGISAGGFSLGTMPPGHTYSLTAAAGTLSLTVGPLAGPSGLAAVAGTGQVSLTWSPAGSATGYNLKRSTQAGGPYTVIAANVATPSHVDTGVTNGTRYYYVVSALYSGAESLDSAEISALPLAPLDPAELLAPTMVRDGNLVHLSTASSSLGRSYQLQRSLTLEGSSWENIGAAIPGTGEGLTFDDSPPPAAERCFFRIFILP
ncbi:autotransporter-associated beta strand repeat-containing protein [Luteolibacter arcticus]|uniref:Autotransporter-associated beta strand repeat-containing protein n=1 Tax=Luteolibacter arcticus TaxID=1581411 RepID=A0ABT3GH94_9BACT|nr:autotransporter-associated beta strand repeat-containing protein [Luteolibacter arcticus]MCW1922954.1 autotransporter-associated beta strand repeat-containing protein [Luteolibacter arcticus]